MRRRIVLDTNCLLPSISRRSRYYPVWERFICGEYDLCVTTEILAEYEEIVGRMTSPVVARLVVEAILRAPNTLRIEASFTGGAAGGEEGCALRATTNPAPAARLGRRSNDPTTRHEGLVRHQPFASQGDVFRPRPSPCVVSSLRPSVCGGRRTRKPLGTRFARLGRFPKGRAHPQGAVNSRHTKNTKNWDISSPTARQRLWDMRRN